jgi:hypothetical protein
MTDLERIREEVNNRPASLWNVMRHSLGYSTDCADEIVVAVEEWLVKQIDVSVNKVIERLWEQSE